MSKAETGNSGACVSASADDPPDMISDAKMIVHGRSDPSVVATMHIPLANAKYRSDERSDGNRRDGKDERRLLREAGQQGNYPYRNRNHHRRRDHAD
jgi:hypothetical protein